MRIGILGAGNIGGTLARLWSRAGHEVMVSSRHPEKLTPPDPGIGSPGKTGSLEEAARFGEVVLLAIPFAGLLDTVPAVAPLLAGKVVIDAMNPFSARDGSIAEQARARGASGLTTRDRLPDARLVRSFSTVNYRELQSQAHRLADRVAVPMAGDDPQAKEIVARLIRDAGFEPYDLGPLADSSPLDPGGALFGRAMTRRQIEAQPG
jgi:hypothetical protein